VRDGASLGVPAHAVRLINAVKATVPTHTFIDFPVIAAHPFAHRPLDRKAFIATASTAPMTPVASSTAEKTHLLRTF
jgi:hypothetical protein